jgi:hypothetical protein
VIFLRPYNLDLITIRHILDLFGHASGLRTNLAKSSVSPIHCTDEDLTLTANILLLYKDFSLHISWPPTLHWKTN